MCILDLEESEVTNDGTQALWEMTRTAVIRGLITSCDGSFLMPLRQKVVVGAINDRPQILLRQTLLP